MVNVAILTDSNSGITQAEALALGVYVVPMPFHVGEETYFEDINMTNDEFYEFLSSNEDIYTSQPTPASVMEIWETLLKDYKEVIYIPMSSGLSGSCATSMALAREEEFEGKVFVVDNQRISVTQRQSVIDAKNMAEKGLDATEIRQRLLEEKMQASIYVMVDTLKYLKKGGRITPAAAAVGTILKIKPVLQIHGEKLDAFAKVKTLRQAKSVMTNQIRKDIENLFGGLDKDKVWLHIAHTKNDQEAEAYREEIKEVFEGFDINIGHLSLSVSCHLGPGALALACTKKMEY